VTERWLRDPCPGTHLLSDSEDRQKITVELFVSAEPRGGSKSATR
jgi:hypothetical protein